MKKRKRSAVKKSAWIWFSRWIRLKAANAEGEVQCVTCKTWRHWKDIHAGHFIPRSKGDSIFFVTENVHPQCAGCNTFKGGNLHEYYPYMESMYGREGVEELKALSNTTVKLTLADLIGIESEAKAGARVEAERIGESL